MEEWCGDHASFMEGIQIAVAFQERLTLLSPENKDLKSNQPTCTITFNLTLVYLRITNYLQIR